METGAYFCYARTMQKTPAKTFRKHNVIFAYQFGSTIDGTATRESDLDIAVYFDKKIGKKKRFEERLKLISQLQKIHRRRVDVVALNDTRSLFFKFTIIKEGKRIYETPREEYVDYECRTMSRYFDYKPFLEEYNKAYVKRHAK